MYRTGYKIYGVANTAIRTRGKDIITKSPRGNKLWISVKGYPEKSPHTQVRRWFSSAIFDLLLYRNESSFAILALGMPDGFTTYLNLAARVDWLFKVLSFKIYLVDNSGHVRVQK